MLTDPPITSQSDSEPYNPYVDDDSHSTEKEKQVERPREPDSGGFANSYYTISRILGFREKYSLVLCA
jgi:hypothetical protein